MGTFLSELGTKLGDRVLMAVTLPGLLWTACLIAGRRLGWGQALAFGRLSGWIDRETATGQPAGHTLSTIAIGVVGLLVVSSAAGLAAGGIGTSFEWFWSSRGTTPAARWLIRRRHRRWQLASTRLREAVREAMTAREQQTDPHYADSVVLARRHSRLRVSVRRPERPTWIGDRFALAADRAREVNGIDDVDLVWPRLWPRLPDALRTDITAARDAYSDAARLCGWGLLYAVLAFLWWPAALVAVVLLITGCVRGRSTASAFADLLEATLDLHLGDLAEQLGLAADVPADERGAAITNHLRPKPPTALGTRPSAPPPVQ
ncbi:hypothetical protein [Kitasatospora mediocidica]|uniref:hypothetical protein n=1 Tax=Kitasatospora mediocidica TaxID=58352 RepID=UPI000561B341|nr:hypothetical protein [Kitasatospora mediocidica]